MDWHGKTPGKQPEKHPYMAISDIQKNIDKFFKDVEHQTVRTMKYVGEGFVRNGRGTDTYKDRTANLRNSIGYGLKDDGTVIESEAGQGEGAGKAKTLIAEVANKDKALVLVAGMEYAAQVESRGYDVISGSVTLARDEFKQIFPEVLRRLAR